MDKKGRKSDLEILASSESYVTSHILRDSINVEVAKCCSKLKLTQCCFHEQSILKVSKNLQVFGKVDCSERKEGISRKGTSPMTTVYTEAGFGPPSRTFRSPLCSREDMVTDKKRPK